MTELDRTELAELTEADVTEIFNRRPERSRPCEHCRGLGHVAEPYGLAPVRPGGVPIGMIPAIVVGSAHIYEVTREAKDLAGKELRPVAFNFMGKLVVIWPNDDPDKVARTWWEEFYGETPEESAARR